MFNLTSTGTKKLLIHVFVLQSKTLSYVFSYYFYFFQNTLISANYLKPFHCPHCKRSYTSKYGLRQHKKTWHQSPDLKLVCKTCQKCFFDGRMLAHHKNAFQHYTLEDVVVPQTKKFMCEHCNFQSDAESSVRVHYKYTHSTLALKPGNNFLYLLNDFECPFKLCKVKTFSKDTMRYHFFKVHSSEETFQNFLHDFSYSICQFCKEQIPNSKMKEHLKKPCL